MSDTITLRFSLPPAELRRNHGQGKYVSKHRAAYSQEMLNEAIAQGWRPESALTGKLRVRVEWHQIGHGDVDNCLAGAKATLDALGCAPQRAGKHMTYLGVYDDDAQIVEIIARRFQALTKADEHLTITITRLDGGGA